MIDLDDGNDDLPDHAATVDQFSDKELFDYLEERPDLVIDAASKAAAVDPEFTGDLFDSVADLSQRARHGLVEMYCRMNAADRSEFLDGLLETEKITKPAKAAR